jgi:hypothetical protein
MDRLRITCSACGVALLLLALPAVASAADTFADASRPDDSGDCLTLVTACKTISGAVSKAGSGDTVHVVPGLYPENVTLSNGKSLIGIPGNPDPTINPTTGVALTVTGGPAGTISGMTFVSNVANQPEVVLDDDAGSTVVTGNKFIDPTPTSGDNQAGVRTTAQGTPVISDNTFVDLFHGIEVLSPASGMPGVPLISGNDISGVHHVGDGIQVSGIYNGPPYPLTGPTTATLIANKIHGPGAGQSIGVFLTDGGSFSLDAASPATGVTMIRNRIIGGTEGVEVIGNRAPVTMFGDVIARTGSAVSGGDAVLASSVRMAAGVYLGGDLTVTNADIVNNNNLAFELQDNHLTLDSSIVRGGAILTFDGDGTASCTITFSDGMTTSGGPCETFQTSAAPSFVDEATDDYHLTPTGNAALIDQGNPLAPPPGTLDFDGDPRAIDSDAACPLNPVRDIGADEVNPGIPNCAPPPSGGGGPLTPAGPMTPAGPTGQRAAALNRCKHKHSKRGRRRCRKRAKLLPL